MTAPSSPRFHPLSLAIPFGQAHELVGCSRAHFWRLDKAGRGPSVANLDGVRVVTFSALDEWLSGFETKPTTAPKGKGARNATD